jgi:Mycothiol maleylpyruvate isomerase N-terminal domain
MPSVRKAAAQSRSAATAIGHWTVRDVAAHVAGGAELYARIVRGTPSPAPTIDAITALNEQIIGAVAESGLPALADRVETAVAGLLAAAELHQGDPDGRRPWLALTLPSLFRKP